eukprot:NODE_2056_length_2304_cov_6.762058.p2 GENE.NODE_2056_length_2304_cov_6.762058~~NODE_2056_length_2304_cov_6.762058.p2  ORF type:complete len:366 (+),score=90.16 NODE_2056_length_2304_cov_6.762058:118-1098(+)
MAAQQVSRSAAATAKRPPESRAAKESVPARVVATAARIVPHVWKEWEDLLKPHLRHGLVVGKLPLDLLAGWPREVDAYPTGYAPVEPPGCCNAACVCMDGTRRPEPRELRKPWLDDVTEVGTSTSDGGEARSGAARAATDGLVRAGLAVARGATTRQRFLEPTAAASRGAQPPSYRRALHRLTRSIVAELSDVLRAEAPAVAEAAAAGGLRLPFAAVLPEDVHYAPLRVDAAPLQAECVGVDGLRISSSTAVSSSTVLRLKLIFPEGALDVVMPCGHEGGHERRRAGRDRIVADVQALPSGLQPLFSRPSSTCRTASAEMVWMACR